MHSLQRKGNVVMIDRDKFDLEMWRSDMGFTQGQASVALGITRKAYNLMANERTPLSTRTAMACLFISPHPDEYKKDLTYP